MVKRGRNMNFKKIHASEIFSAALAGVIALSVMTVSASADTIGSASIYLADETWSSQVYWGNGTEGKDTIGIAAVNPVEITGDGTYTTSVEFEKAMDYGFIFSLNSDIKGTGSGSFADYPDAEMSITSVKADGREISGNASISDINDNGYIKINIFDPLTDASENYAYGLDWTSGIKSMEVTFTVTGTGILSSEASEEDIDEVQISDVSGTPADESEDTAEESSPAAPPSDEKAEGGTEAPDTGNAPISPMAAVTALAGLIVFMTKKRK